MKIECAVRVIDLFLGRGVQVLFGVALALFAEAEPSLFVRRVDDEGTAIALVTSCCTRVTSSAVDHDHDNDHDDDQQAYKSQREAGEHAINIDDLIDASLNKFRKITIDHIQQLRLKHRITVIQSLEDSTTLSILRSVKECIDLDDELLNQLYVIFKYEYFTCNYWRSVRPELLDRHNTSRPLTSYRVDYQQFSRLFVVLPWSTSPRRNELSLRIYKLLQTCNMIDYLDFAWCVKLVISGSWTQRLKMLFLVSLQGQSTNSANTSQESTEAAEAEEFFENKGHETTSTPTLRLLQGRSIMELIDSDDDALWSQGVMSKEVYADLVLTIRVLYAHNQETGDDHSQHFSCLDTCFDFTKLPDGISFDDLFTVVKKKNVIVSCLSVVSIINDNVESYLNHIDH